MKIGKDCVVSIDYTLRDDAGAVIDSSEGQEPLLYLHGHDNIVEGLEEVLAGKGVGESVKVSVAPEKGYGVRDIQKILKVPRKELPKGMKPEKGMQIFAEAPDGGHIPLWITEVHDDSIIVDGNHPLAGQTLHFAVDVRAVRAATSEELHHGHPHGPDGHSHHHH